VCLLSVCIFAIVLFRACAFSMQPTAKTRYDILFIIYYFLCLCYKRTKKTSDATKSNSRIADTICLWVLARWQCSTAAWITIDASRMDLGK